jgi:hypothetical protein
MPRLNLQSVQDRSGEGSREEFGDLGAQFAQDLPPGSVDV